MFTMRQTGFGISMVLSPWLALLGMGAHALEPRLVPSIARPTVAIPATREGKRLAVQGGGALLVAQGDMAEPDLFSIYSAEGNLQSQIPLKIPGASRVVPHEDSRSAAGTLVDCGFAESPETQRAPFLMWISADGGAQTVIRTEP